ncbi:uncharacterized protein JCM6883_006120 [Sporobolomyces salmoneus]|uniref:uncharacterized protein n=1 Tax=Sporobolomyces salmoneus TaxID=183962 RepID=UPI003175C978
MAATKEETEDEGKERNKTKRSPSRRISQLVSRFEPPPSPPSASSSWRTYEAPSPSLQPPARPAALVRSWSKLGGGKVEQNVRRFSGETEVSSGSQHGRRSSIKSLDFVSGSIDAMDWTPRSKKPLASNSNSPSPQPPSPAARFLHSQSPLHSPSKPPQKSPPQLLSSSAQKSSSAKTIIVPASVESSSSEQNPKLSIVKLEEGPSSREPRSDETKGEAKRDRDSGTKLCNDWTTLVKIHPNPEHTDPFDTISSASPSFATSEATLIERSGFQRPALEHRKTSLTFVDLDGPLDNSSVSDTPQKATNEITSPKPEATLTPSILDLPDSPPPPRRPPFSRGGTSLRTMSTVATHSYPAHQIFARDAAPLYLPELDKLLESIGGPSEFTHPPTDLRQYDGDDMELKKRRREEKGDKKFGTEEERKSWNEWVRGSPPSICKRLMGPREATSSPQDDKERLIDGETSDLTKEQHIRSLIFPPFHRLPPDVTLSDLKSNIRKPPPLLSGNSLIQIAADGALNLFGSAAGIRLTTVEGLRDLMQMITLLSTSASPSLSLLTVSAPASTHSLAENSTLRTVFITIPSALSLDFASAFGQALLFLFVLTFLAFLALYEFYRFTGGWGGPAADSSGGNNLDLGEGYDREDLHVRRTKFRDRKGWKIAVTFFLTSIYLPLSKLSLSALFWERGYWPSELFDSDPQNDRCFTTIPLGGNGFNSAIVIFPVALLVLGLLAGWFPIRMYRVVQGAKPSVDEWTELGELRRDKKGEYERLLDRDPSPFSFLYREYRREWAAFRSIYMLVKLVNVFIVVLISTDNCVFLNFDETKLDIIRQGTLFAFMSAFFLLDVYSRPQLDKISNRSDRISRFGYVGVSLCGLLVALSVPGKSVWDGSAIVVINAFSYTFNFYFAIISTQLLRRFVKRVQRRLDFSIDVFSPQLDLSKHVSRRIWQETFSTLILTAPEFAMSPSTTLKYCGDPPYLLNFRGSVAERHAENLKILREIGLDAYYDGMKPQKDLKDIHLDELRQTVQHELAGPDVYFRPAYSVSTLVTTFFGRLDIVPFPFAAVFRYDQDPPAPLHLSTADELEELVRQQNSTQVRSARKVRLALRALEGQLVYAPRIETTALEKQKAFGFAQVIRYEFARIKIDRNSSLVWQGYNCSSGFEVSFEWKDGVGIASNGKARSDFELVLPGSQCGIFADFSLTKPLAILFQTNRQIIDQQLSLVEDSLARHRRYFAEEAELKRRTLSYDFLFSIYAEDGLSSEELDSRLEGLEVNEKVKKLVKEHPTTFKSLEERMKVVTSSRIRAWWFIVFDDLYRRNGVFQSKPEHFSPHYSSSICYRPMPRAQLEAFLRERGFATGSRAFFSRGFLNQIYYVLDEIAFSSTDDAVPLHLASDPNGEPVRYSSLPRKLVPPRASEATTLSRLTAGTGDGTNEDDRDIRARRGFLFEEAFERPRPPFTAGQRWEATKFFFEVRLKRGAKRWLGWTLNETDHRKRGEDEILLDLRKGKEGWQVPHFSH